MNTQYQELVCLVGENPLPVYFGIRQFAAEGAKVVLVYSDHTEDVAQNIREVYGSGHGSHSLDLTKTCRLESAHDPEPVGRALTALAAAHPRAGLNFTGGTKIMSALAVDAWRGRREDAFYLDEGAGAFRFLSCRSEELNLTPPLTLDDLSRLHRVVKGNPQSRASTTTVENRNVWRAWKSDWRLGFGKKLSELSNDEERYDWFVDQTCGQQSNWADFIATNLTLGTEKAWCSAPAPQNADELESSDLRNQLDYVAGKWLEHLIADVITYIADDGRVDFATPPLSPLIDTQNVAVGQEFTISGAPFECDVLVVHNNRLRYLSMTTSPYAKLIKQKGFEAIHRAQQLGGGLARACVVSLASTNWFNKHTRKHENTRAICQRSVDPTGYHRIFGVDDVKRWVDVGDAVELKRFLTTSGP